MNQQIKQKKSLVQYAIKAILVFTGIVILAFVLIYANHRVQLYLEKKEFPPIGKLVEVNHHKMHIYAEGEGAETLVFLSGSGTTCPSLNFKPLYERMSDQYRIAVVERAGYGYSEATNQPRDIDTVLEETRSALQSAGEKPPYVLLAHSLSGLEAIYWAQSYPDEIKAIIGLDAAVPGVYLGLGEAALTGNLSNVKRMSLYSGMGVYRLKPSMFEDDWKLLGTTLSEDERKAYKAITYRNFISSDVVHEGEAVYGNAQIVEKLGIPVDTPMYFFISDGKEVGIEDWQQQLKNYVSQVKISQYQVLDCGHYVFLYQQDKIAAESKKFLSELQEAKN